MDSLIIERDVLIVSDDVTLHDDVFRPRDKQHVPVIITLGPY